MPKQGYHIPSVFKEEFWFLGEQDIWLGNSMKMYRNLEKYNFPSKLESTERKQVLDFISRALLSTKFLESPKLFHGENLVPLDKEYLYEHFQGMESFHQAHIGDGFVIDKTGRFLFVINVREHLQLQIVDSHSEYDTSFQKLSEIENELNATLKYAFSKRLGYLTANVFDCGCALKVHSFLQVPALIHTGGLEAALKNLDQDEVQISGMHESEKDFLGDVVAITNRKTIGVSEEQILSAVHQNTSKLLLQEQKLRNSLGEDEKNHLKDQISRAFGLLNTPFQLEIGETLEGISLLKLGLQMGWVKGANLQTLNHVFFQSRRAHLITSLKIKESDFQHIEQKRANFVKGELKKVKLVF